MKKMSWMIGLACGVAAVCGSAREARSAERDVRKGEYAVVISKATYEDPEWNKVVDALAAKHAVGVITWDKSVEEAKETLVRWFPKYACFVGKPEEVGRPFVVAVHRMTRALDEDPYPDLFWGILTGYDAADAVRIAGYSKPLEIVRAAGGTGIDLDCFEQGMWCSEGEAGLMMTKLPDQNGKVKIPNDSTQTLVTLLNDYKPQFFMTSGHATTRDWQIGYSYRNGQFRCKDGQLVGIDLQKKVIPINSPEPKIYLPAGNCLIGQVDGRDAMALAWMHTGGAYQMAGYTAVTFFGYMGWGMRDYLVLQSGRYTFNEAFIANSDALIHQMATKCPKLLEAKIDQYDMETNPNAANREFAKAGVKSQDEAGMLWDRDIVAFYGDPAWEARVKPVKPLAWDQKLTEKDGTYTLELSCPADGKWAGRPVVQFLPHRVKDIQVTEGANLKPVVTDNFVLVPMSGDFKKGDTVKVSFKATKIGK